MALQCEVKNPLGAAAFLAALRAYVDQTAPKMTAWRNSEYNGQAYVKVISAPELARNLDPILQALEESGTTLIIKHHDQPAALLVRFDAYVAMLATMDYSGWERWIEEVRAAFPTSVFSPPRRPTCAPWPRRTRSAAAPAWRRS